MKIKAITRLSHCQRSVSATCKINLQNWRNPPNLYISPPPPPSFDDFPPYLLCWLYQIGIPNFPNGNILCRGYFSPFHLLQPSFFIASHFFTFKITRLKIWFLPRPAPKWNMLCENYSLLNWFEFGCTVIKEKYFSSYLFCSLSWVASFCRNTIRLWCSQSTLAPPHCNENPIYVFLFWDLRCLSPNFPIHVFLSDLYIRRIGPHISCSRIGRSIVGIYKSFSDIWMWKLRLWPRNSFSRNICFKFSVLVLCSALSYFNIPLTLPSNFNQLIFTHSYLILASFLRQLAFKLASLFLYSCDIPALRILTFWLPLTALEPPFVYIISMFLIPVSIVIKVFQDFQSSSCTSFKLLFSIFKCCIYEEVL